MSLRNSSGLVTVPSVIGSSGRASTFSARSGFHASRIRDAEPTCSGMTLPTYMSRRSAWWVSATATQTLKFCSTLKKQAVSPVLSRISLSTGLTTANTSRSLRAVAAQYDIRTPTRMRSPVLSSRPWAAMLLTSRWTVEVGSPVACWISPSVISGCAREKASRISVILPSTNSGCCLDEAAVSSFAMTRMYSSRSHTSIIADDPVERLGLGPRPLSGPRSVRLAELREDLVGDVHHRRQRGGSEPVRSGSERQVLTGGVAAGAGRERAATEAAKRTIDHRGSGVDRGEGVRHAEAPGVVSVKDDTTLGGSGFEASEQVGHLRRYRLPDGVAYDDVVGSSGAWVGGDADHSLWIGQALERTGERRRDAQLDGPTELLRNPDGVGHRRDAVFGAAPDVGLVVRVRRREAVLEVTRAGGGGLLDVPWRRHPDPAVLQLVGMQRRDDVERVGKWRNEIRARHRTDLERRYAKSEQLADDLYLAVGGQHLRRE